MRTLTGKLLPVFLQSFGTPLEDALRRDFTINSMFYNVNDEVIEDYTGQGYIDLQSGLLRTPLEPLTTLLDDPLRALRAVRFASRYAFDLAPDLLHCMACDEVQAALISKVSRERVGRELEGMLGSARPIGALRMLHQLQLLPLVLPLPQFASKQEVQAVVDSGGDGKRQGKASTAMAAMERFPYAPGAPEGALVDCHGTAAFDQGMQVVNALEQVFHALVGGGTSLAAACLPSAAQAPAAGAGGAGGAPEPSGGTKRPANVSLDSSAEMHPRVRVVVPATDGGKEVQCCNPYAEREDTSTQSPAEKAAVRRAQQLQTARDSSGLSADVRGDDMMSACLACALWAVRGHLVIPPAPKKRQPKPVWGVLAVLREGLKSGNKQADAVKAAQDCAEALLPLLQRHAEYTDADRLALGLAIREAGPLWMPALHVAVAIHALSLSGGVVAADTPQSIDEGTVSTALEAGSRLAQFAHSSGLWQAWAMKPLLSGKELMKLGAPGGSGIAQYIDAMLHWQLLHPSASVEEALVMAQGLIQEKAAGEAAE